MDRLLMYVYMIVTVVATCTILIRTQTFEYFDQYEFKHEIALERDCKQEDVTYRSECDIWYAKICIDENNRLHPFFDGKENSVLKRACEVYIGKL